jgi:hypothetical protein
MCWSGHGPGALALPLPLVAVSGRGYWLAARCTLCAMCYVLCGRPMCYMYGMQGQGVCLN